MSGLHGIKSRISKRFGEQHDPTETYLSYYDTTLTRLDYDSIKNDWLTDTVICFWQEYLEHEKLDKFPNASIELLRPSMSYMLYSCPDPTQLREALPQFSAKTHIFLPINDNDDSRDAEGGSHWSLLVVSTIDGVAFHYDSLGDANVRYAQRVAWNLQQLINTKLQFRNMEDCPLQNNSSDCGVFVCLIMRHLLLKKLLRKDRRDKVSMSMVANEVNPTKGRMEIRQIINERREEGQRRKSRSASRSKDQSDSPPRIGDD